MNRKNITHLTTDISSIFLFLLDPANAHFPFYILALCFSYLIKPVSLLYCRLIVPPIVLYSFYYA